MSEQSPSDLTVPRQEAGFAFRAEMAITNFFLGYWRHLVALVVIGLVAVFVYGQWASWQGRQARDAAREISEAKAALRDDLAASLDPAVKQLLERSGYSLANTFYLLDSLPPEEQMALATSEQAGRVFQTFGALPQGVQSALIATTDQVDTVLLFLGPPDDAAMQRLDQHGDALLAIAEDHGRAGGAAAALEASEAFRLAGQTDKRRQALEMAAEKGSGVLHYAAVSPLADMDVEAGQPDAAIARLKDVAAAGSGPLAQDATIELANLYEVLGRDDEARQVYADFLTKWPDSARSEEVQLRQTRLGSVGEG